MSMEIQYDDGDPPVCCIFSELPDAPVEGILLFDKDCAKEAARVARGCVSGVRLQAYSDGRLVDIFGSHPMGNDGDTFTISVGMEMYGGVSMTALCKDITSERDWQQAIAAAQHLAKADRIFPRSNLPEDEFARAWRE